MRPAGPSANRPLGAGGEGRHRSSARQLTFATGYVALGLLGLTLLVGPANPVLRRRNPVSSHLRRDVGTWTAIASAVHVIFGFQVHGGGRLADFLDHSRGRRPSWHGRGHAPTLEAAATGRRPCSHPD